jgi:hypothetical protein
MRAHLLDAIADVLEQGKALLADLDQHSYATALPAPFNASIGAHYRHVLEHFICLLAAGSDGYVNYDGRNRSVALETDPDEATRVTNGLIVLLRRLPHSAWTRPCTVEYSVGYSEQGTQRLPSTYAREAAFCVGHAVHHYAIIRLLCAQWRVDVPLSFGVAPSTLKHQAAGMTAEYAS